MPEPSTNGTNGHDAQGHFTRGNPGGPGNPHAARIARLRSFVLNCISEDELIEIVRTIAGRAKAGNLAAVKILFEHLLSKPGLALDPDRLEIEALKIENERLDLKDRLRVHNPAGTLGLDSTFKTPKANNRGMEVLKTKIE